MPRTGHGYVAASRRGSARTAAFELGPADVGSLLAPPPWLRDLGVSAWLLAGVAVVTVAGVWLASLTRTIVMPVITAAVVAAVASDRRRARDDRGPAARERPAAADGPADRLRGGARDPPLAVLIVTIAGGCLFGAVGLVLAAPLTSAATRIAHDLDAARAADAPAPAAQPA